MRSINSSTKLQIAACLLLLFLTITHSSPLKSYELRDLEELLNDEERMLEDEIEEMEDIKKELLKKSADVRTGPSHQMRKEVISVYRPTPKPPEGVVLKRYTPSHTINNVPEDPDRIAIENPNDEDIQRQKLPQTPKPPEKIEKPALPPTPGRVIRTTPPYVPVNPEANKINPGPAFRPTPKYVWDGEKFVHVAPERKSYEEQLRERRFRDAYGVSCADIKQKFPSASSGIYEIRAGQDYVPVAVYCNMDYVY